MERLTKTYSDGTHGASDSLPCGENSYDYKNLLIERLGKYEDLEEQGRLLKLPCKVGDTVYYINPDKNTINELVVYGFDIRPLQRFVYDYMGARLNFNQFGKTVFLIESEAEAKLKELRGREDESSNT